MNWSFLVTIVSSVNFLSVLCAENGDLSDHEPLVAMWCGKVNKHMDPATGQWVTDKNGKSMCSTSKDEVLRYCKHVYPKLDVQNIVEVNEAVTIDKWCEPDNVNCTASKKVIPFRCLVGHFEADALLVPKGCRFEHLHRGSKCKSHDLWRGKAEDKCKEQSMILRSYGVLIPCNTGMFTGVEFVCCPNDTKAANHLPTESVRVVPIAETDEPTTETPTTPRPTTFLERLEMEIKEFSKNLPGKTMGCDRNKYHLRRQKMENEHRMRMSKVIKQWETAEKRYNVLRMDDPKQAEQMVKGVMERFKKSISILELEASLERQQLHEEHHQCVQIDMNDKRHRAIRSFLKALRKSPPDSNAALVAVRKFLKICTEDRVHNRRHFEQMSKHYPDKKEELRTSLQEHLQKINERVNETMILLYKLPKVARKFYFELPTWAPKPKQIPTETPTATELDKEVKTETPSTKQPQGKKHHKNEPKEGGVSDHREHDPEDDDEDEDENDEDFFGEPRSPATFAAVIGLSCGALVIMIVIIIAMAMRKSRGRGATKTVLVDPDAEGSSEKQHLTNLQENGYENPTYRFYDY